MVAMFTDGGHGGMAWALIYITVRVGPVSETLTIPIQLAPARGSLSAEDVQSISAFITDVLARCEQRGGDKRITYEFRFDEGDS